MSLVVILLSTFTFLLDMLLDSHSDMNMDEGVYHTIHTILDSIDGFALAFFTAEYIIRLVCSPNLCR